MTGAPLLIFRALISFFFFFFNDTATTEIYTLSLHDALPISRRVGVKACWLSQSRGGQAIFHFSACDSIEAAEKLRDRKSTRLNSSHGYISYAVFCLKKKKKTKPNRIIGRIGT